MEEIGIFQYFVKNGYNIDHREDRNIFHFKNMMERTEHNMYLLKLKK